MRTSLRTTLLAAALFAAPIAVTSAHAAMTVFGDGAPQACYQAALTGRTDIGALHNCDLAVAGVDLDQRDRAASMVNRGVVHLKRKDAGAALADFDKAIALRPEIGEAHVDRGAALIMAGDYRSAITSINRGLELGANDPQEAYFNRAVAHEALDDLPSAYADYMKALELKPDWELPRVELARFTVSGTR